MLIYILINQLKTDAWFLFGVYLILLLFLLKDQGAKYTDEHFGPT